MKTVRDRSIRTSFPDALGSLAKDVLNQAANQVADRLAKDQDVSEFPDILTFEEWTEELEEEKPAQYVPSALEEAGIPCTCGVCQVKAEEC